MNKRFLLVPSFSSLLSAVILGFSWMSPLTAQVRVSSGGSTSTNTYNITNSGDAKTVESNGSGALRIARQQFVDVSNETGLASAMTVASALSGGGVVRVTNEQSFSGNVTVPANVLLYISRNGKVQGITATDSLLVKGQFYADNYKCFDSTTVVKFWPGSVALIRPDWWLGQADSSIDAGVAFTRAIASAPYAYSGTRIQLTSGGVYRTSTTITLPSDLDQRPIILDGNGAKIVYTGTTAAISISGATAAGGPTSGPRAAKQGTRHTIRDLIITKPYASRGTGAGILLQDCVQQRLEHLIINRFAIGVHLKITSSSQKWVEGTYATDLDIKECLTGIEFTAQPGGTNSTSFRNTYFNHVTIGGIQSGKLNAADTSYGIKVNQSANLYECDLNHISIFPQDTMVAVYWNGKGQNTKGQISIETVGSADTSVIYWRFGPNSRETWFNEMKWSVVGVRVGKLFVFDTNGESYNAIQGLVSQAPVTLNTDPLVNSHRGLEYFMRPGTFTRIRSFTFPSATSFNTGLTYVEDVAADSTVLIRTSEDKPMEFLSIESGGDNLLGTIRVRDLGRNRSVNDPKDSSMVLSVRNCTYIVLGSKNATFDSIKGFVGAKAGQTITVSIADDSVYIYNLLGGSGRIFTGSNSSFHAPSGYKMTLKAETDATGIFWRTLSEYWPTQTVTYNPPSIDADTDTTTGTVSANFLCIGAAVGDPVQVTHTQLSGKWMLYGYGVSADSVTVVFNNKTGATVNLASGTLKMKLLK